MRGAGAVLARWGLARRGVVGASTAGCSASGAASRCESTLWRDPVRLDVGSEWFGRSPVWHGRVRSGPVRHGKGFVYAFQRLTAGLGPVCSGEVRRGRVCRGEIGCVVVRLGVVKKSGTFSRPFLFRIRADTADRDPVLVPDGSAADWAGDAAWGRTSPCVCRASSSRLARCCLRDGSRSAPE